jgi:hypothetical protein
VNRIINDSYVRGPRTIHIEPNLSKKNVEVRYRWTAIWQRIRRFPSAIVALISRIKIMSRTLTYRAADAAGREDQIQALKRRGDRTPHCHHPHAGGWKKWLCGSWQRGEVMRLEDMGPSPYNYKNLSELLKKPYGMILAVGPTVQARRLFSLGPAPPSIDRRPRWTAEDPLEISQYGLRQVQVQSEDRIRLRQRHAGVFSGRTRCHHGGGDEGLRYGEDRGWRHRSRSPGVQHPHTNSAPETIVRLLDHGDRPPEFRGFDPGDPRPEGSSGRSAKNAERNTIPHKTSTMNWRQATGKSSSPGCRYRTMKISRSTGPEDALNAPIPGIKGGWESTNFLSRRMKSNASFRNMKMWKPCGMWRFLRGCRPPSVRDHEGDSGTHGFHPGAKGVHQMIPVVDPTTGKGRCAPYRIRKRR